MCIVSDMKFHNGVKILMPVGFRQYVRKTKLIIPFCHQSRRVTFNKVYTKSWGGPRFMIRIQEELPRRICVRKIMQHFQIFGDFRYYHQSADEGRDLVSRIWKIYRKSSKSGRYNWFISSFAQSFLALFYSRAVPAGRGPEADWMVIIKHGWGS